MSVSPNRQVTVGPLRGRGFSTPPLPHHHSSNVHPYVSGIASTDPILVALHCSLGMVWYQRAGHSCQWSLGCERQSRVPKRFLIQCLPRCWRRGHWGTYQRRKSWQWIQSKGPGRGWGLRRLLLYPSFGTKKVLQRSILVGWDPWSDWDWGEDKDSSFEDDSALGLVECLVLEDLTPTSRLRRPEAKVFLVWFIAKVLYYHRKWGHFCGAGVDDK